MKEELQSKLVEILTSMQTTAGKASDFALEQLPDIAQSYVLYGRVTATASLLAFMLVTGLGLYILWCGKLRVAASRAEWVKRNPDGGEPRWNEIYDPFAYHISGGMTAVFGVVLAMFAASHAALVWFAPKVWLLKQIAGMLK